MKFTTKIKQISNLNRICRLIFLLQKIEEKIEKRRRLEEEERCQQASDVDLSGEVYTAQELQQGIASGFFSNLMLILGVFAFAYTVKALLQSLS